MSQTYELKYSSPEVTQDTIVNLKIKTKWRGLDVESKTIPIVIKKKQEVTQPDSSGEIATNLSEFNALVKQYEDGNYYPTLRTNTNNNVQGTYSCSFVTDLFGGATIEGDVTIDSSISLKGTYIKVPTVSYSNPFNVTKATLTKK